jgi:hypothetical protein
MSNNGNMAAMPTQSDGGDIYGGLTKSEMMAMHFHAALLTAQADGIWSGLGVGAAYHAVNEADELLAELGRAK